MYDAVEINLIVVILSWNNGILRPHGEIQGKYYILMDLPVYGEQIKPSPIFIASFSRELWFII